MDNRTNDRPTTLAEMRAVLDAVAACPDRGATLPHSRQPECGCAELTECRAGCKRPAAVTLEACVRCHCEALGLR